MKKNYKILILVIFVIIFCSCSNITRDEKIMIRKHIKEKYNDDVKDFKQPLMFARQGLWSIIYFRSKKYPEIEVTSKIYNPENVRRMPSVYEVSYKSSDAGKVKTGYISENYWEQYLKMESIKYVKPILKKGFKNIKILSCSVVIKYGYKEEVVDKNIKLEDFIKRYNSYYSSIYVNMRVKLNKKDMTKEKIALKILEIFKESNKKNIKLGLEIDFFESNMFGLKNKYIGRIEGERIINGRKLIADAIYLNDLNDLKTDEERLKYIEEKIIFEKY